MPAASAVSGAAAGPLVGQPGRPLSRRLRRPESRSGDPRWPETLGRRLPAADPGRLGPEQVCPLESGGGGHPPVARGSSGHPGQPRRAPVHLHKGASAGL